MSGGDWKDMFGAAVRGDVELVRFHVAQGIDVNYAHPEFLETALVASILAGHAAVAHVLLDGGADPEMVSPMDALTPLAAARQVGLTEIEQRLTT
jgi:ankyrin repeat protein